MQMVSFDSNVPWKHALSSRHVTLETGEGQQEGHLAVEKSA